MNISQIYVYFNKDYDLVSKSPYIVGGTLKQGSSFELYLLFDNYNSNYNTMSLQFIIPGETKANLFPFLATYDKYVDEGYQVLDPMILNYDGTKIFEQDLTRFGIVKDKEYHCWKFSSEDAYDGYPVLTERDGYLKAQGSFSTYYGTIKLGEIKLFVEKAAHYESPFDVSQGDLDRFLKEVRKSSENISKQIIDDLTPDKYVEDIKANYNEYSLQAESIELNLKGSKEETLVIDLPVPQVKQKTRIITVPDDQYQVVNVKGTGKTNNPLEFSFELHKPKDGYGIHGFVIDEQTGELLVYAENSDDLSEGNYEIIDGELVIKL